MWTAPKQFAPGQGFEETYIYRYFEPAGSQFTFLEFWAIFVCRIWPFKTFDFHSYVKT